MRSWESVPVPHGAWGMARGGAAARRPVIHACARQPMASRPRRRLLHRTPRPIFATPDRFLRHHASSDVTGRGARPAHLLRAPTAPARADRTPAITFELRCVRIAPIEPERGPLTAQCSRSWECFQGCGSADPLWAQSQRTSACAIVSRTVFMATPPHQSRCAEQTSRGAFDQGAWARRFSIGSDNDLLTYPPF